jgi:hypothetical protein
MMRLPLPALLSAALVAFTMEFDNQAERQLPHRTTRHGSSGGLHAPWLVSLAMWANCMQFVDEREITVLEIWSPLSGTVESRWENRFGRDAVCRLRRSLEALVRQLDRALPDCLPILGYGLERRPWQNQRSARRHPENLAEAADSVLPSLPLWALLSRPLLAFAMEFERQSGLSLAASANLLRVLDEKAKSSASFHDCPECRRRPLPWRSACSAGRAWRRWRESRRAGRSGSGSPLRGSRRASSIAS